MPSTAKAVSESPRHAALLLEFTDDEEANRLVSSDPLALLIGFVLDQQVTVEKAFAGPKDMLGRVGTLDAAAVAAMDPAALERAFSERPAVHRFPRAMARRVHELCRIVATEYGGDASRIWSQAANGHELLERLRALPGFGPMKAATVAGVLAARYAVQPPGWQDVVPRHPTLAGVVTADERRAYQAEKRAYKRQLRAAAAAK